MQPNDQNFTDLLEACNQNLGKRNNQNLGKRNTHENIQSCQPWPGTRASILFKFSLNVEWRQRRRAVENDS